jgi:hypothetical protein
MNNRGFSLGFAILSSLFILIVGLMLINFLTPEIDTFRAEMSCASPSDISDGTMVLCLVTDTVVPYFIVLVFSLLIGGVTSRFVI